MDLQELHDTGIYIQFNIKFHFKLLGIDQMEVSIDFTIRMLHGNMKNLHQSLSFGK